jgi:hypothetical protein
LILLRFFRSAVPKAAAYLYYLRRMFEFCLPTGAKVVPEGPDWLHDGHRLERDGDRVRLITRGGAATRWLRRCRRDQWLGHRVS